MEVDDGAYDQAKAYSGDRCPPRLEDQQPERDAESGSHHDPDSRAESTHLRSTHLTIGTIVATGAGER